MSLEQQRKENRRELAQRDEELEDARCSAHKKVKGKRTNMLRSARMILKFCCAIQKPDHKRHR
jgi:hypothetical protein